MELKPSCLKMAETFPAKIDRACVPGLTSMSMPEFSVSTWRRVGCGWRPKRRTILYDPATGKRSRPLFASNDPVSAEAEVEAAVRVGALAEATSLAERPVSEALVPEEPFCFVFFFLALAACSFGFLAGYAGLFGGNEAVEFTVESGRFAFLLFEHGAQG